MKNILLVAFLTLGNNITFSQNYQIFFPFGGYHITDKQRVDLRDFIKSAHSKSIILFGYTDTVGSRQYNKTLAAKRIKTVENELLKNNQQLNIQIINNGEDKSYSPRDRENRKVEIYIKYDKDSFSLRSPVYKVPQEFTIDNNKDTTIKGTEGTELFIPAGTFVSENGINLPSNTFLIKLTEYYDPAEMIEAKLTTTSNHSVLETAGMIYMEAFNNKHKCKISDNKQIGIKFKNVIPDDSMQLFYGKMNNSTVNWELQSIEEDEDLVFQYVEQMPEFPGGYNELLRYLGKNTKYPEIAIEQGISGIVYTSFIVNEKGSVINPQIVRGVAPSLEYEALRVIKTLPKWTPGKQSGKPVSVLMTLPIRFILEGGGIVFIEDSTNRIATYKEMYKRLEKEISDSTYNKQALNYLILKNEFNYWTRKLEWINCDRFYKSRNAWDLKVKTTSPYEEIYVIFNNNKSMLSPIMITNHLAIYKNLPRTEDLLFIGMKIINGNTYFSSVKTKPTNKPVELEYKQIDPVALKTELRNIGL